MIEAKNVGKYFYIKNNELTPKQIQKLTYYAYAWFIVAKNGTRLFEEPPQAWVHGPVFRSLYDAMRYSEFYNDTSDQKKLDSNTRKFLDTIYTIYGKYPGNDLERLTHSESPWKKARERAGLKECPTVRSMEEIKDEDIIEWGNT